MIKSIILFFILFAPSYISIHNDTAGEMNELPGIVEAKYT
ncbi:hypothetical protein C2W64_01956 [Brevibacillus laterosporus]|nr:hypothetical protein C2W64_01956 [Brevibacillus laterosporus]